MADAEFTPTAARAGSDLQPWLDKLEIAELVRIERLARDSGNWDALAACYVEDSYVRTTWFEGTAREFADASRDMAENGRHSKHPIWPIQVRVNEHRGLVESHSQIQNRSNLDGVEVDMVQYCRFFSQAVRADDGWRLLSFEAIYGKDTITPVNPHETVPMEWSEVEGLRRSYRIWAWAMLRRGYQVNSELLGDDRPELVQAFYGKMDLWLSGALA
jgi:hypothetical protein